MPTHRLMEVCEAAPFLESWYRTELPGGTTLSGTARGLGPGGTLLIEPADRGKMDAAVAGASRRGELLEVSAADVVHLRR